MKKLFSTVMVIAALLSTAGAFATNNSTSVRQTMYYSDANQNGTAGTAAPNQIASNYHTLPAEYSCSDDQNIVCTYQLVSGSYRFTAEKGLNSKP